MLFWIEFSLATVSIVVAYAAPRLGACWFDRAEQMLIRLARRRGLAVLTVGLAALALRATLLPMLPIPEPACVDEFGYLLLADTFSHGRLTNPTHPMWLHFEGRQIFWQPTYTAKFYPAQGVVMALGQVLLGHPYWGVWLSVGVMCAVICWMLQGWLPPGWALLGGILAVIRLGTFSYWANSYFGGSVTAIGGCLVLGAFPRVIRSMRLRDTLLMGLGFAIVATSRPYEGLFFGLAVAGGLVMWPVERSRPRFWFAAGRVVAPLLVALILTGLAMGYYFWRTTGSPWETPYFRYERTYSPAPQFPWQSMRTVPVQSYRRFCEYFGDAVVDRYQTSRTVVGFLALKFDVLMTVDCFYLGPALTLPLFMALVMAPCGVSWKDVSPNTRFLMLVCGAAVVGSMLPIFILPHYVAAVTGAILALVLQAMRYIRSRPAGIFVSRAIPAICLLLLVLRAGAKPLHLPEPRRWLAGAAPTWCALVPNNLERAATLRRLQQCPGRQLVIVHYGPHHDTFFNEWVYNPADIDGAKVLWARDMGPSQNKELIDYFRDRTVWLVEADDTPATVSPYRASP